jgi:putative zinc finger/helix-turn-helix YgiT family protein
MMKNSIPCAVCSSESAEKIFGSFRTSYDQIPVELSSVEMYSCSQCGEKFFTPDQAKQVSKMIRLAVRDQLGLLSPDRIVEIRRKYGLSQDRLEVLLGLGQKVVTRWETGRVLQTKQADDLLRIIDKVPDVVDILREIREEFARNRPPRPLSRERRSASREQNG